MDRKSNSGGKIRTVILTLQINGICRVSRGGKQLFRDENPEYGTK